MILSSSQTTASPQKQKELELFDRKVLAAIEGLQPFVLNYFKAIGIANGTILADYAIAARNESNISDLYRKEMIKDLFMLLLSIEEQQLKKKMNAERNANDGGNDKKNKHARNFCTRIRKGRKDTKRNKKKHWKNK